MTTKIMSMTASALLLAGTAPTAQAQGVSVYNSFPSARPWDMNGWMVFDSAPGRGGQEFTPTASGNFDHAVFGLTTSYGGPVIAKIELCAWTFTSSGWGYVNPPLESWTISVSGDPTDHTDIPLTITSSLKPWLASTQAYAFVVEIESRPPSENLAWGGGACCSPPSGVGQIGTLGGTNYQWFIGSVSLQVFVTPAPAPPPSITSISLAGTNLVLNGANGSSGRTYRVLMNNNAGQALSQWTPVATNVLTADGDFTISATNAVDPSAAQRFYILQLQ
jgi:hypothetical protein